VTIKKIIILLLWKAHFDAFRQTERQTLKQKNSYIGKQKDRQTERQLGTQANRKTGRLKDCLAHRQTDRQVDRLTD
jgi:hypothetical protein